jgi:predicted nuclease of restriction endonuclease-like RecB superfamily
MKGRKPDESKMDCILGKTDFLEELTEKQRLTWVNSIGNEDLLKYYNLAESSASHKNTY